MATLGGVSGGVCLCSWWGLGGTDGFAASVAMQPGCFCRPGADGIFWMGQLRQLISLSVPFGGALRVFCLLPPECVNR